MLDHDRFQQRFVLIFDFPNVGDATLDRFIGRLNVVVIKGLTGATIRFICT
jgi:hypothetical protein